MGYVASASRSALRCQHARCPGAAMPCRAARGRPQAARLAVGLCPRRLARRRSRPLSQFLPFPSDPRTHPRRQLAVLPGAGTGATPSASTTTSSTACRSSRCTWDRGASSRSSRACRTSTARTTRRENLLKPFNVSMEKNRAQAAVGDPLAEPRVLGHARRRVAHRLRELVRPARAARRRRSRWRSGRAVAAILGRVQEALPA